MKMKHFQRLMAFVLVLCMVIPMLPEFTLPAIAAGTSTTATEKPVIVVAGSDFQNKSGNSAGETAVKNLLTSIKNNGGYNTVDGFLFAGDYSNSWYEANTTSGVTALKGAVNSVYPGLADGDSAVYVQGNHDPTECITNGVLSDSGAHDTANYGVFVINEDDFEWSNYSDVETVTATANRLRGYLMAKIRLGYTKPIFVVSHVPLHYTMRTRQAGDSMYGDLLYAVLDEAADAGLNIIFMYGHNHSASWEDSHGGTSVFYTKGDKINIAQSSQTVLKEETLNFTYMNAGYVGYYTALNDGVDTTLNMSVFEITGDTVKIARYDASGLHPLKSAGVANTGYTTYTESDYFAPNTTTKDSPYTLTLNKSIEKSVGEVAVTVTVDGVVKSAKAVGGASDVPKGYSAYETVDISVEDYTNGDTAVVTLPVSSGFDASRPVIIIDHERNKSFPATSFDGSYVTFETDHFSLYTVAQADTASVTSKWNGTMDKYLRTVLTNEGLTTGIPYVITEATAEGNYQWMVTGTSATKSGYGTGLFIEDYADPSTSHVWYFDGTYIRYGSADGQYMLINTNDVKLSSTLDEAAAAKPVQLASSRRFNLQRGDGTAVYLNRHGGTATDNVALTFTQSGTSHWYIHEVVSSTATLTVTASQEVVTTDGTIQLVPSATVTTSSGTSSAVGSRETTDVTVTWESMDESYATVDANGLVTPKKAGQVYIRATLNTVEGLNLDRRVHVDILLTVVDIDVDHITKSYYVNYRTDSITATTTFGYKRGDTVWFDPTNLTPGGPYLIADYYSGWYLTGRQLLKTDPDYYCGDSRYDGLEMVSYLDPYNPSLWTLDSTGLSLGATADTSKYLVHDGSKLTLGSAGGSNSLYAITDTAYGHGDSNYWNIYYLSTGTLYMHHRTGRPYNVATQTSSTNGYWQLFTVIEPRQVSLTVSPHNYTLCPGDTEALTATVKVDGTETSTYAIKWYSSDNSVVTVSSTGEVTGIGGGNAVITATLTSADGQALDAYLSVEIPVQVATVTSDGSSATVTYTTEKDLYRVADLVPGTPSGPYLIDAFSSGHLLSGNYMAKTDADYAGNNIEGLELLRYYDYDQLWYYDGTYLRFGNTTDTDNYLILKDGKVVLGALTDGQPFNNIRSAMDGTYAIGYLTEGQTENVKARQYLNQSGGANFNVVGLFYLGTSEETNEDGDMLIHGCQSGTRWRLLRVVPEQEIALMVSPAEPVLRPGDVQGLTTSLTVDGEQVTDYKVKWSIADSNVATIYQGKLTGVAGGTTTVTATLTKINGETLADAITLNIPVTVKSVASATLSTNIGEVAQRASSTATVVEDLDAVARTSVYLNVTYMDGTTQKVPVTLSMLTDADGKRVNTLDVTDESGVQTLSNLTVRFGDYTYEGFTLKVVAPVGDDYPDYPNEGSVYVDKTGTGIIFTSTGVAQIELTTTGVPVRTGADVIIMLDTSSSMDNTVSGNTKNRREVLVDSLNQLIGTLQQKDVNGQELDIKVAVADFNNYFVDEDSPYYINPNDTVSGGATWGSRSGAPAVFTGSHALDADAFVDVHDVEAFTAAQLDGKSGTNYDYAFDAVYQLGTAIKEANSTGEERDLFVIFMSDGCPFQFNFHSASSNAVYWNNWVTGTMTDGSNDTVDMFGTNSNRSYYNAEGKHWTAEAIKGDPRVDYSIIRKNDYRDTDGDNWIQVPGLGATMYSIGFCLAVDGKVTVDTMDTVLQRIASSDDFYFRANTASELDDAFGAIAGEIMYSASNAYFMDTMGEDFDIQLKPFSYDVLNADGEKTGETVTNNPFMEVRSYSIFTPQDHVDGKCTLAQIGDRKTNTDGSYIYTVLETVTFNAEGTEAYSNGGTTNILTDGVICANTFWYNTSKTETIQVSYNGMTIDVAPETFCWKVGTISTSELALNYFVYLTGSMEGDREAGVYDTNAHAELFYTNYLGHRCSQEVATPKMPWEQASVGYAFYLVNANGEPIIDQATGKTGSFKYAVELTRPIYNYFYLNNGTSLFSSELLKASDILPDGYKLYDTGAGYKVSLNSNGIGAYTITSGVTVQTTYVDGIEANAVTRPSAGGTSVSVETHNYVTANTVVWFAVVAETSATPDSVVIDYGLPVDIHPLVNDLTMTTGKATLAGIGTTSISGYQSTLASGFVSTENSLLTVPYGQAMITDNGEDDANNAVIRYIPGTMQMDQEAVFTYAVYYTGTIGSQGYYYSTITVIPATSIYYEDNFQENDTAGIVYGVYDAQNKVITTESEQWSDAATAGTGIQDEDRPGNDQISFGNIDANNIYGYDSNYTDCTTYSLGNAKKVTVNANKYATATFTFKGTGFDVISLTNADTGTIVIEVNDLNKAENATDKITYYIVDTYYGYQHVNGSWVVNPDATDTLYQVPVMKVEGLDYSQYKVTITATYADFFDHDQNGNNGSYDFYLDAIRVYDPAGNVPESTVVQGAYTQDTEGWPSYEELRNKVIDKKTFDTSSDANLINGLVFIDGKASVGDAAIADYTNYGPNNELYLAKGQAVAFTLTADTSVASVHMAMKSARTTATPVKIGYYSSGKIVWTMEKNIETATDLYYDLTALKGKTVVIQNADNAGDSILSITNIKTTYTSQPGAQNQSVLSLRKSAIQDLVAALNASEDLEQLPATGDMGMSFVMMVLTASMFMLAVLVLSNTRKRNAK